jgi:nitroreductase
MTNILEPSFPGDETNVAEKLVTTRYSCRSYLAQSVPHETILRILTAAQQSASWCNSQAWQLYITEGAGTERFRAALSQHAAQQMGESTVPKSSPDIPMPDRYVGMYGDRRRECGLALYASLGISAGDRVASRHAMLRNFSFFGAPHIAIVTTPRDLSAYGAVDCGSYLSTFMIVARAHGVATIAQGAIAVYSAFVREHFQIPVDRLVLCGISFGYDNLKEPVNGFRTRRARLDDVVTWITT